jgi:hypothetical protein
MRYLKTFESFSPINEEFLGLDNLYNKVKSYFTNWKDEKQKKAAEFLAKAIEDNKDNPEMKKALQDLKAAAGNLAPDDKAKIQSMANDGIVPNVPETKDDAELKSELKGGNVSESLILEEESELVGKIIKYFGLTTGAVSLVTLLITVAKIALAGSGYPTWLFGLSLGTIGGILMVSTLVSGIILGVGSTMTKE